MKCSAFIATSADGYIATSDGGIDWLQQSGRQDADMSANPDMGFEAFVASVDCMIMGRKCMETLSSFNLAPEQWPYGNIKIYVLSRSLTAVPDNVCDKVELYSGDLFTLINRLESEGYDHAYIDGGTTVTSFLNHQLIDEITITQVPILLGCGIPLFGEIHPPVMLEKACATVFPNDFIQIKYTVNYSA